MVIFAIYISFLLMFITFFTTKAYFYIKIVGLYSTMLHIHTGFEFILHTRPYFVRVWIHIMGWYNNLSP